MKELTHLSLFTGIGGLDLAAEWAGFKTVGQCEWADYPTKVLEKHWPDVPRWRDIRTLTGESFYERTGRRTVDVISGGFPCQPFSVAGKRRGKEDDRFLWPEMVRVIKELRPAWVIGENVAGIVNMALAGILSELESCGYSTRTFLIPACAVGARHIRYRAAIVACADSKGRTTNLENSGSVRCRQPGNVRQQPRGAESEWSGKNLANAQSEYKGGLSLRKETEESGPVDGSKNVCNTAGERLENRAAEPVGGQTQKSKPERPDSADKRWEPESILGRMVDGLSCWMDRNLDKKELNFIINHYWDVEPDIPRIAKGIKHRKDRVMSLGNAVVPQRFYPIFRAIAEIENQIWRNSCERQIFI